MSIEQWQKVGDELVEKFKKDRQAEPLPAWLQSRAVSSEATVRRAENAAFAAQIHAELQDKMAIDAALGADDKRAQSAGNTMTTASDSRAVVATTSATAQAAANDSTMATVASLADTEDTHTGAVSAGAATSTAMSSTSTIATSSSPKYSQADEAQLVA
jgi:hypothetical protein